MKIGMKKTVEVEAKTLRIHTKVCDMFQAYVLDQDGQEIGGQDDGYVPSFMPEDHDGDYLILNIDIETGQITNWKKPTQGQIEDFISKNKEDEEG